MLVILVVLLFFFCCPIGDQLIQNLVQILRLMVLHMRQGPAKIY